MLTGKIIDQHQVEDLGTITIRYPKMDDAKGMLDYLNSVIKEQVFSMDREKDMEWELSELSEILEEIEKRKRVALVIEVNDEVMGFGDISRKTGAHSHSGELGIGLKEKIREKGIGSRLIGALIKEAKKELGIEMVILETYRSNDPAINLYKKFGFEEVGEIDKGAKYGNKYKDIVIMKKDLE